MSELPLATERIDLILVYPYGAKHLKLFSDLEKEKNVCLRYSGLSESRSRIETILRRIHFSKKLNRLSDIPGKYFWHGYSDIFSLLKKTKNVLIIDSALRDIPDSLIKKMQANGARIDLFLINSINAASPRFLEIKARISSNTWNHVYTFDPLDAKNYGFTYQGFNYYSKQEIFIPRIPEKDAYFVGGIKGNREKEINSIYRAIAAYGGKCDFNVMVYKNQSYEKIEGIHYILGNWTPYEEILKNVANCNTIIEILQEGQSGASLRYFEAVCYNKKLLTNNPNIVNFPFYDKRYMRIFRDAKEIDPEWVCQRVSIDYHYGNEFSPKKILDEYARHGK